MTTNDFDASIARIDSAKDLAQASCFAGEEFESGYWGQIAYIQDKRGVRATSGYFQRTVKNVRAKFAKVWAEDNPGKPAVFPSPGERRKVTREVMAANTTRTDAN